MTKKKILLSYRLPLLYLLTTNPARYAGTLANFSQFSSQPGSPPWCPEVTGMTSSWWATGPRQTLSVLSELSGRIKNFPSSASLPGAKSEVLSVKCSNTFFFER